MYSKTYSSSERLWSSAIGSSLLFLPAILLAGIESSLSCWGSSASDSTLVLGIVSFLALGRFDFDDISMSLEGWTLDSIVRWPAAGLGEPMEQQLRQDFRRWCLNVLFTCPVRRGNIIISRERSQQTLFLLGRFGRDGCINLFFVG